MSGVVVTVPTFPPVPEETFMTQNPEAGNPTEPVLGTIADADTSHVDGVIADVAAEHEDAPQPVSVSDQNVEDTQDPDTQDSQAGNQDE